MREPLAPIPSMIDHSSTQARITIVAVNHGESDRHLIDYALLHNLIPILVANHYRFSTEVNHPSIPTFR